MDRCVDVIDVIDFMVVFKVLFLLGVAMTSMTSTHRSIGSKSKVSNVQNRIQRGNRGFSFLQALDTQIMMIEAGDRCVAGNGYVLLPTVFNNGTEIDNAVTMESSAPISLNKQRNT
jgi:hypothetical protein